MLVLQRLQKGVADFCLPCEPLVLGHRVQGAFDDSAQVLRDNRVRVGRIGRTHTGATCIKRRNESLKLDCEKLFV